MSLQSGPVSPSLPPKVSAYQRSLLALAEAVGSRLKSTAGADDAARHAQAFLQQPQSP